MRDYKLTISKDALLSLLRRGKADIRGSFALPCVYDPMEGGLIETGEEGVAIDFIEVA